MRFADILASPWKTLAAGGIFTLLVFLVYLACGGRLEATFSQFLLRWLHIAASIVWIGLVWFVNFVQIPASARTDDAGRAVIGREIAPRVAFWFRHASSLTLATGAVLLVLSGTVTSVLSLGAVERFRSPQHALLGIGIWLAVVMLGFVHGVIWPNLQVAVGLVPAAPEVRAAARAKVHTYARLNLVLSVPVTFAMVSAPHLY